MERNLFTSFNEADFTTTPTLHSHYTKTPGSNMSVFCRRSFCVIATLQIASYFSCAFSKEIPDNGEMGLDDKKCGLYLAESSIPGAGLGLYVGVDVEEGDLISYPDICINLLDMEHKTVASEYSWSSSQIGSEFEAMSVDPLCSGLGMLTNCHGGLINAENAETKYDGGGLHRSTHAGAGAITYYHDYKTRASKDIPAGSELFISYGEDWFLSRTNDLGDVPLEEDFIFADHVADALKSYKDSYGHKTTSDANDQVMELVRNILDLEATSRVLQILPDTFDDVEKVIENGSARYSLPESIRSLEWLETNGHCVDNMKVGPSTIPAAGRGAFATRHISEGSVISVSPLLLFHRKHFVMEYGDGSQNQQLATNYCLGHPQSTWLARDQ
uniref:SET domain-containing protein n=1 Tax=Ditylum brightwellii TaxID=49249 RepID=A0A7S4RQ41_9STRA